MAKVLIDIPEENLDGWRKHKFFGHCLSVTEDAVANGIVLDNLTNGEVLMKMFSYLKPTYIDEWKDYNNTHSLFAKAWVNVDFGDGKTLGFDLLWWNSKWGE